MENVTLATLIIVLVCFIYIIRKLNILQRNDEEVAAAIFTIADYVESEIADAKKSHNLVKKLEKAGVRLESKNPKKN